MQISRVKGEQTCHRTGLTWEEILLGKGKEREGERKETKERRKGKDRETVICLVRES